MKQSFNHKEFFRFYKTSKSLDTGDLFFKYGKCKTPKIGFTVSRKYGKAHDRNLFKRRCRHLYHLLSKEGYRFGIIIRPKTQSITYDCLRRSFIRLRDAISH